MKLKNYDLSYWMCRMGPNIRKRIILCKSFAVLKWYWSFQKYIEYENIRSHITDEPLIRIIAHYFI